MLDERWVFHDDVKAEQAGEGVIRRVLAYSRDLMCVENTFETGAVGKNGTQGLSTPYVDLGSNTGSQAGYVKRQ